MPSKLRMRLFLFISLGLMFFLWTASLEAQTEVIIDNGDIRTSSTGTWGISGGADPYGPNSLWARDGATYTWTFTPTENGSFELFMWWSGWASRSSSIPVDIQNQAGTTRVTINQQLLSGRWNSLGTYSFAAGVSYKVTITSQKYPTSTCADAVKFVNVVAPPNRPPVAKNDAFTVTKNSVDNALNVLANDSDPDAGDTLAITAVGIPNHGGAVIINGTNDGLVYSPTSEYVGTETFTYTVKDPSNATAQATVTMTVNETAATVIIDNGNPGTSYTGIWALSGGTNPYGANSLWARDGATYSFSFSPSETGDFDVFMWWSSWPSRSTSIPVDIQHQGGTSRVVINQLQNGGQWNKLGTYAFQKGTTYKVTLTSQKYPTSTCADAVRFTSAGAPPNNPPVANDDSYTVNQNSSNNPLAVLSNDSDPDPGDTLTVSAVGTPNHGGSVVINATSDGVVYTPAPGFIGIETFTYTVQDSGEATDQAMVTVTVNEVVVNRPPVANDDTYTVNENSVNNALAVLSNDSDPDSGDTITISAVGTPNHGGSVVINAPKTGLVYTPASGYSGIETFSYTIRDVAGATDTATVAVTVEALPVNHPPVANDDSYTVNQGSQNNALPVLSNDSDPDAGDTITILSVGTPNHGGSVAINAPKTGLVYTPAAAFSGLETFTYTLRDVAGATDQATVDVTVQSGGLETEDIYICYMYQHWWSSLETALQDMGCQQINSDLWKFENPSLNKQFMIHLVRDVQGTIDAMKIPKAFLIIAGHANYGLGPIPGTNAEKTTHIIPDIYTIDDPRIINISTPILSVSISGLVGSQAYPNWQPIYQDGTDGRMPFGFNDPKGPPAYNYYITYQVPGDPTHYKIETSRYSALIRFPDAPVEPWYSPDGAEPNVANPDHLKHFIVVPAFFQMVGAWLTGDILPGFQGRNYNYLPSGTGANIAQWDFRVLEAGNYRVSAWWPAAPTNTTAARYTITHSSGSATVVRDQTVNGSQWNQLGEYYFTPGGYKVQLSDLSVAGDVIADALRVTAVNNIPAGNILNAEFYARSRAGDAPFNARFSNMTIGEYTAFEWNFGDGTTDNLNANPSHTYENPGIYTVSLSVTGPAGTNTETKVGHIYVGQPPTLLAEFSSSDEEVNVPYEITFSSRSSGTPTNWSWTFGDGSSTTGWESPRKTYTVPGLYTVSLTVSGGGQTNTETKQNLIRANLFDMTIDNVVPSYHYARKTCLFLREPDIRNDEMKFSRLFYDSCNSGNYYLGRVGRGIIMYSVASSYGWAHLPYLEGYMHGLSDEELWVIANDDDPNKLDYYNFTQAPATLTDSQAPISLSSISPLRRIPDNYESLTPEREARIAGLQNLSFADAWDRLRNVTFLANRTYFRTAIFTALGDRSEDAVAFALEKLKSSGRDGIGEDAGYKIPEWRLAMEVLRVFSQDALGRLFDLYHTGSPADRRDVIHVLSGIPGEGMIKDLLVRALYDQSACQEGDEDIEGIPLRVCDEAYNELVSRYDVRNTLRVIGTAHRLADRDYHVGELRKLFGADPERISRPDRQRKR
jgi:PKD repeat protein